jgi:hypothetical protein
MLARSRCGTETALGVTEVINVSVRATAAETIT